MDCTKQNKGCCKAEIGRGCTFCNCSSEPEAELSDGCFKLHETPWLEEYPENFPTDLFEVRFKNTRRGFYQNVNNLPLKRGDVVAVEASPGHDIGIISLTGDLVAKQMRRTGFNPLNGEFKKIYRKAKPFDIERWQEAIALEQETMIASRQIAADMGLNMKIGDVEYQGDKIKAIFYYIADERVDFRELIKVFAERFHIRIEMKQIGARQEAGRIGGLGACGRELCCASWISSFTSVTTGAARMQDISLNPQKLAGQCSKLKCCMMYEYDTYVDARKDFPRLREPLQTLDGEFFPVKSDVLAGTMTFSSSKESLSNLVTLSVARVKEIMAMNRAGKKADRLQPADAVREEAEEPTFRSEEDSITRFDQTKRRKNRRGKGREERENDPEKTNGAPRENSGDAPTEQTAKADGQQEQNPRERRDSRRGRDNRSRQPRPEGQENRKAETPAGENPNIQRSARQEEKQEGERRDSRRGRDNRSRQPRPEGQENRKAEAPAGENPGAPRPAGQEEKQEGERRNGSRRRGRSENVGNAADGGQRDGGSREKRTAEGGQRENDSRTTEGGNREKRSNGGGRNKPGTDSGQRENSSRSTAEGGSRDKRSAESRTSENGQREGRRRRENNDRAEGEKKTE